MLRGNETWKRRLREVKKAIISEPRRIIGNEPIKAVELSKVNVGDVSYKRPVGVDEMRLPPGVKVRCLFAPGKDDGGNRGRATDPVWSLEIYDLDRIVIMADQPVLYYLSKGSGQKQPRRRSFVREELQVVPEDTELPPDHVLERYTS